MNQRKLRTSQADAASIAAISPKTCPSCGRTGLIPLPGGALPAHWNKKDDRPCGEPQPAKVTKGDG